MKEGVGVGFVFEKCSCSWSAFMQGPAGRGGMRHAADSKKFCRSGGQLGGGSKQRGGGGNEGRAGYAPDSNIKAGLIRKKLTVQSFLQAPETF